MTRKQMFVIFTKFLCFCLWCNHSGRESTSAPKNKTEYYKKATCVAVYLSFTFIIYFSLSYIPLVIVDVFFLRTRGPTAYDAEGLWSIPDGFKTHSTNFVIWQLQHLQKDPRSLDQHCWGTTVQILSPRGPAWSHPHSPTRKEHLRLYLALNVSYRYTQRQIVTCPLQVALCLRKVMPL